jgi:hypothetical protein
MGGELDLLPQAVKRLASSSVINQGKRASRMRPILFLRKDRESLGRTLPTALSESPIIGAP